MLLVNVDFSCPGRYYYEADQQNERQNELYGTKGLVSTWNQIHQSRDNLCLLRSLRSTTARKGTLPAV